MALSSLLLSLALSLVPGAARRPAPRREARRRCRPRLEALEDRTVPSTFVVTNTLDTGPGSLRQAILAANADSTATAANPHLIKFAIPATDPQHCYYKDNGGPGVSLTAIGVTAVDDSGMTPQQIQAALPGIDPDYLHTWYSIKPATDLPSIINPVVIDGYTQPGASPNTLANGDNAVLTVELNLSQIHFASASPSINSGGLVVSAGNSTIEGLVINHLPAGSGALLQQGGHNRVQGNFIGTDVSGTLGTFPSASGLPNLSALSNADPYGVQVERGSRGNVIGTDGDGVNDPAERNLISAVNYGVALRGTDVNDVPGGSGTAAYPGSAGSSAVAGNFIGVDRNGLTPLGNWEGVGASG